MNKEKRKKLEEAGWTAGSATELLGLTAQEQIIIELKLLLSRSLKEEREKRGLSQSKLASLINSSQSRVAKMEANDPGVSFDLLLKAILATGVTRRELAAILIRI
ncbi:MAG: helix-turn-helix domain-containing protein [Blastocatellales bacterium]